MSKPRYPEESKIEALRQVTERGLPVAAVAARLSMSTHSRYDGVKRNSKPPEQRMLNINSQRAITSPKAAHINEGQQLICLTLHFT